VIDFHFLRPLWLFAIPFVIAFAWRWRSQRVSHGGWSDFVDAHLLDAQFSYAGGQLGRWLRRTAPIAACIALVAMAGPAWEKTNAQTLRDQTGRVFVLDLSLSMNAADIKPSRLTLARLKLLDLLAASRDMQVGLVVFAAEPYVVSPLSDDALTLRDVAAALTTDLVPAQGATISKAIDYSNKLLEQSGVTNGELILITDSELDEQALASAKTSAEAGVPVSVLAVGTEQGAPVPNRDGTVLRGADGRPLIIGLPLDALEELAESGDGRFTQLQTGRGDIDKLLARSSLAEFGTGDTKGAEQWKDRGPLLLWLLLPWGLWFFGARKV